MKKCNVLLPLLFSFFIFTPLLNAQTDLDIRLRYESVDQDNALKDADALTVRTRLAYTSESLKDFSFKIEFEDSRTVLAVDDFNNTAGEGQAYSVIADPATTEVDQAYVQYRSNEFVFKLGRQVIALDDHRFVGHVGWRQDRQTFDGVSLNFKPTSWVDLKYNYLTQRNRIFAENRDIESKDHLVNLAIKSKQHKVTAYGYLLDDDSKTDNSVDTYGVNYKGKFTYDETDIKFYAEYAHQSAMKQVEYQADYYRFESQVALSHISLMLGWESLGSDSGMYGFSTPLATLHKFNGWADQFLTTPTQGLEDLYLGVSGKLAGGKWRLIYHRFNSDTALADGSDDLGSEIDVIYTRKLTDYLTGGIKYAHYRAGSNQSAKVDTDKLWLWLQYKHSSK